MIKEFMGLPMNEVCKYRVVHETHYELEEWQNGLHDKILDDVEYLKERLFREIVMLIVPNTRVFPVVEVKTFTKLVSPSKIFYITAKLFVHTEDAYKYER